MSVVSSRVSSVSSILKSPGVRSQLLRQSNRVCFKLPKNLKELIYNLETGCGSKDYEDLIYLLRESQIKDNDLLEFLCEIRKCIPLLGPVHKLFIDSILQIKWTNRPKEVASAYKVFLEDLICMQIYHIKAIIDNLVEHFKPAEEDKQEWEAGVCKVTDKERLNHIHDVLCKILKVIPMSSKLLLQSIRARFPYVMHRTHTHEVFVHALLQILEYAPQLRSDIFSLIISRLMVLDVNIPKPEIEEFEDEDITEAGECNEMLTENDLSVQENKDGTESIHPMAHTLDVCLDQVFTFMHNSCYVNGVLDMESLKSLYFDVLKTFETVILPTHGSQYVQYVMFYLCSFKISVSEAFIDWLWRKAADPNVPYVTRQSAASYIASLISMAKFIPLGVVKSIMLKMTHWIHNYVSLQECSDYVNVDVKEHGAFYSICQGLFFMITSRHKDFVESKNNMIYLHELYLSKIVTCKLNPLKACQLEIAHNFADVARTYQLAYCYTIIENNTRTQLPVVQAGNTSSIWCDTFFPFDEYNLARSGQRLAPLFYNNQKSVKNNSNNVYNYNSVEFMT